LTIVQSSARHFRGFMVTMTTQVGCATTHDYPTQATTNAVEKHHDQTLSKVDELVTPAFRHFVSGQHPFRRFVDMLDSERKVKKDPNFDYVPESEMATLHRTDYVYLQGMEIQLYLKKEASQAMKSKLCFDFLLSQTTRKESGLFKPYTDETSKNFFESDLEAHIGGQPSTFQWRFEYILGYIINNPEALDALANSKHVEKPDWGYDWNRKQKLRHFRARAMSKVLGGQPYGKDLIEEAKRDGDRHFELYFLLVMASDAQAAELKEIINLFDPSVRQYYEELA
jgi:hypothetical protein